MNLLAALRPCCDFWCKGVLLFVENEQDDHFFRMVDAALLHEEVA